MSTEAAVLSGHMGKVAEAFSPATSFGQLVQHLGYLSQTMHVDWGCAKPLHVHDRK